METASIRLRDMKIAELTLEVNSLKNLIRSLPETPETTTARSFVSRRRWEEQIESESNVTPSETPLYAITTSGDIPLSNPARKRIYEGKRSQVKAGLTKVFPIETN